jgi:hypothetical protein
MSDRSRRNSPVQPRPTVKSVISVVSTTAVLRQMCRQSQGLGRSFETCPDPRSSRRQPIQTDPKSRQFIGVSGPRTTSPAFNHEPTTTTTNAALAQLLRLLRFLRLNRLHWKTNQTVHALPSSWLRVRLRQIPHVFSNEDTKDLDYVNHGWNG